VFVFNVLTVSTGNLNTKHESSELYNLARLLSNGDEVVTSAAPNAL